MLNIKQNFQFPLKGENINNHITETPLRPLSGLSTRKAERSLGRSPGDGTKRGCNGDTRRSGSAKCRQLATNSKACQSMWAPMRKCLCLSAAITTSRLAWPLLPCKMSTIGDKRSTMTANVNMRAEGYLLFRCTSRQWMSMTFITGRLSPIDDGHYKSCPVYR